MSKIATFLGRRVITANSGDDAQLAAGASPDNGVTVGEGGVRLGKEHEALRTMLGDAARRIDGLGLVKEAYEKLSEPIVRTMQALEQEKLLNATLQNMFAGVTAAHERQRNELRVSKQRTASLDEANEKLGEEVERAQEQIRTVEAARLKLVTELSANRDRIAGLERELAQETAERRRFADERNGLDEQLSEAEGYIGQLETDAATAREIGTLLEAEVRSLRKSLDETIAEAARLSQRLTESENQLSAASTRIAKLGTEILAATTERDRLANALDDANGRYQAETYSLNVRLEALQARAQAAEKLLTETRTSLTARTEEARKFDRSNVETKMALHGAGKKIEELEGAMKGLQGVVRQHEQANEALTGRNNGLIRNLRERETALARNEAHTQSLNERIAKLEADMEASQGSFEKRIEECNGALQRERMERSMTEGALVAARSDYAALFEDYSSLQASLEPHGAIAAAG